MSPVYIARTSEVAARLLGSEMMIMSARDSTLFSLNETATEIVERSLCAQFDVDPAAALRDAEELVEGLAKHGILKLSDQPIMEAK